MSKDKNESLKNFLFVKIESDFKLTPNMVKYALEFTYTGEKVSIKKGKRLIYKD